MQRTQKVGFGLSTSQLHMRQTITDGRHTSNNVSVFHWVMSWWYRCFWNVLFVSLFQWYAFPNFCTQISRRNMVYASPQKLAQPLPFDLPFVHSTKWINMQRDSRLVPSCPVLYNYLLCSLSRWLQYTKHWTTLLHMMVYCTFWSPFFTPPSVSYSVPSSAANSSYTTAKSASPTQGNWWESQVTIASGRTCTAAETRW